jgi:hypothetical protein
MAYRRSRRSTEALPSTKDSGGSSPKLSQRPASFTLHHVVAAALAGVVIGGASTWLLMPPSCVHDSLPRARSFEHAASERVARSSSLPPNLPSSESSGGAQAQQARKQKAWWKDYKEVKLVHDEKVEDGRTWADGPSMRIRTFEYGHSRQRIMVVDHVLSRQELHQLTRSAADGAGRQVFTETVWPQQMFGESEDLTQIHLDERGRLGWTGIAVGFPGLRLFLDNPKWDNSWYAHAVGGRIRGFIKRIFGVEVSSIHGSAISVLCKAPSARHFSNHCPHFDRVGDLASTHYLSGMHGGTSFYRLRFNMQEGLSTAEQLDNSTHYMFSCPPRPGEAAHDVVGKRRCPDMRCSTPPGGLLYGSNDMWEEVFRVRPKVNRLVLYRSTVFHAPSVDEAAQETLSCSVEQGRLTVNGFWTFAE